MAELCVRGNELPKRGKGIYLSEESAARAWGRAHGIAGRRGGWLYDASGARLAQGWGRLALQLEERGVLVEMGGGRWRLAVGEEQVPKGGAVCAEEQPVNVVEQDEGAVVEQDEGAAVELYQEAMRELPPPLPPPPPAGGERNLPQEPFEGPGGADEDEAKMRVIGDLAQAYGGLGPAMRVRLRELPLERLRAMLAAGGAAFQAQEGVAVHIQPPYGTLMDAVEALGMPGRCGVAAALIRLGAITLQSGRFVIQPPDLSDQDQPEAIPMPIDDAHTTPYELNDCPQRVCRPRPRRLCLPGGVPMPPPPTGSEIPVRDQQSFPERPRRPVTPC